MQRNDLNLSDQQIVDALLTSWGIHVKDICYIDIGNATFGFLLTDSSQSYFLKIYLSSSMSLKDKMSLSSRLAALLELRALSFIRNLPCPIKPLEGDFLLEYHGLIFTLYEYVDGAHPEKMPEQEVASLLAVIHKVPVNHFIRLPKENFNIVYSEGLFDKYKMLDNRKGWQEKTYARLVQEDSTLLAVLLKLKDIKRWLPMDESTFVLTHGDLHKYNILIDRSRQVFLIEWDWMLLAPPERDLWFFYYEAELTLKYYRQYRSVSSINEKMCQFYMLNRFLMDVHHFVERILNKNMSEQQKQEDYNSIIHYLEDRLPLLRNII